MGHISAHLGLQEWSWFTFRSFLPVSGMQSVVEELRTAQERLKKDLDMKTAQLEELREQVGWHVGVLQMEVLWSMWRGGVACGGVVDGGVVVDVERRSHSCRS